MKKSIELFLTALWAFVAISTSAAALNTGEGFYISTGIMNLLFNGACIFNTVKKEIK